MTYQKPKIVVYGEGDVTEWAVTQKDLSSQHIPLVACKCTMGQSKAFMPAACHCASGGSRVTYKVQDSSLQVVKAA